MEKRGQATSAHRLVMRAQAEFAKKLNKLKPDLEKGSEAARKALEEGGKSVTQGGSDFGKAAEIAGEAVFRAGQDTADALVRAADPFKELAALISEDKLALEETLEKCRAFLESIDEKLPQHALVE
jgi:phage shock protein A